MARHRSTIVSFRRTSARALSGLVLAAAALAFGSLPAVAADIRQGTTVTVGPGESVNDDIYAFGGTVTIQGTVSGSVIAAGATVTVSGHISRDLIVGGGNVTVSGPVDGSIRATGGTVTLSGPVGGDVVVAGGTVTIASGATIGRDLVAAVGTATVAGPVARRALVSAGTLTLQNKVGGDVTGQVDHLQLDAGAQIGGNLDYTSNNEVSKTSGATVAGTTTRHTPKDSGASGASGGFLGWVRGLIGLFALGLLLLFLLPRFSLQATQTLTRSPWASLGIGAAVLVLMPILAVLVFVVGIIIGGWWIGVLLLAAYFLALALAYVVAGFLLGRLVFDRIGWTRAHAVWALLAGLFILTVIGLVPVVGALVSLAAVLLGLGALGLQSVARRGGSRITSSL